MMIPKPVYIGQFPASKAGDVIDLYLDISGDLEGAETISSVEFAVLAESGDPVPDVVAAEHTEDGGRTDFRVTVPSLAGVYQLTAVFTISDGQKITRVASLIVV